jgi:hypothetical protein
MLIVDRTRAAAGDSSYRRARSAACDGANSCATSRTDTYSLRNLLKKTG